MCGWAANYQQQRSGCRRCRWRLWQLSQQPSMLVPVQWNSVYVRVDVGNAWQWWAMKYSCVPVGWWVVWC